MLDVLDMLSRLGGDGSTREPNDDMDEPDSTNAAFGTFYVVREVAGPLRIVRMAVASHAASCRSFSDNGGGRLHGGDPGNGSVDRENSTSHEISLLIVSAHPCLAVAAVLAVLVGRYSSKILFFVKWFCLGPTGPLASST